MTCSSLLARTLLRAVSWLVPAPDRADWHAEWSAELWHVTRSPNSDTETGTTPLAFVRGAIPDALCLRRETPPSAEEPSPRASAGPRRCLAALALCGGFLLVLALALPGSRHALLPQPVADDIVLITRNGVAQVNRPAISFSDYQDWRISARHLYSGLAFYQFQQHRLHLAPHQAVEATVVRASRNLFDLLGMQPQWLPASAEPGQPKLFISRRLWKQSIHNASQAYAEIAGRRISLSGILPDNQWQLPGQPDAWLLVDDSSLAATPAFARGFIVARIQPNAFPSSHRVMITSDGIRYPCLSLADIAHRPASIFRLALLLAAIAVPATLPIPLGGTTQRTRRLKLRLRAWLFFAAKIILILPLVYAASMLAAYGVFPHESSALYLQLAVAFFGLLFLFRWAWQDQRCRCPECLGRLTHPARVGLASRSFLAWSGTELICASGHGLLHIPALPTSWFSRPRWLVLDPSWKPLFASPLP
ncbi:hypothetical protein [Silvibacterium dinghuense]|uniref:Uncharacterized protein n=1 Tax=Silvibacterium dinghuense TaxID=1560006 RepID=A0A4Q1SH26_9BACT|nr:hypothetical protein [Silvibacterium dinghuense]RXS96633.1 hypothetical protein ESZ00_01405 [Silvibacterium dinghuense]GGG92413.1 hypothetical protein GCM10011586_03870 [Silvibacterium dinghuense]